MMKWLISGVNRLVNRIVSIMFFGNVGLIIWISMIIILIRVLNSYLLVLVMDVEIGLVVMKIMLKVKLLVIRC